MKPFSHTSPKIKARTFAAFTLAETMVAVSISSIVFAMLATFIVMAARSTSGIVKQSVVNGQAGRTSEYIFSRVRYATSVAVSGSGTVLTLGYDTNYLVDSNNDKKAYNDKDRYEVFQFINGDGNDATTANNQLIYKANSSVASTNVLISSGLAKLPGKAVFVLTNEATVLLNYGLADSYAADGYQRCDVQAIFVARNRPDSATVISILP